MSGEISVMAHIFPWGKLRRDAQGGPVQYHSLVGHCTDVGVVCDALLHRTLLANRLAALGGLPELQTVQIARLSVLAFLHDVGKCNHGFQNKAFPDRTGKWPGHVDEALTLFRCQDLASTRECFGDLHLWGRGAVPLLWAALGHHGSPVRHPHTPCPTLPSADLWTRHDGYDPAEAIGTLMASARRVFPDAFVTGGPPLPVCWPFVHAFAGLVTLADWIGSDDTLFPFDDGAGGDRATVARGRATAALQALGLDATAARTGLRRRAPAFRDWAGVAQANALQAAVERLPIAAGAVTVMESDTGSGKTEAALVHFLRLFADGAVDGLYFALPTRAAAVQIHGRVRRAVAAAFGPDAPPVTLAVPGYLRVDDSNGRPLPDFRVLWDDGDDGRSGAVARRWAAERPKRYTAAPIAVGTVDQALLAVLQVKHAHLRACGLLRTPSVPMIARQAPV